MERRPHLRPLLGLVRRLRPQLVFIGRRLTPGGLGLELTTLVAALSVGLFVLISYWAIVAGDPGPTGADRTALDFFNEIRTGWLDQLAEQATKLGSAYLVFPLVAICAAALGLFRRWTEVVVLLVGFALIVTFGDAIKVWTDRPRPEDALVGAEGSAFPSQHAAYSTIYLWLAATIAFRLVPGITRRSLVIAAGIAVTALVGITRAYLRVHWLSDVFGGWGLGVSCFTATAAVALILTHIRDNARRDESPA